MAETQVREQAESNEERRERVVVRLPPGGIALLLLALVATLAVVFWGQDEDSNSTAPNGAATGSPISLTDGLDEARLSDCLSEVAPLDVRVGRPWRSFWKSLSREDCRPGTWLVHHAEPGQSLEEFRGARRAPLSGEGHLALRLVTPAEQRNTESLLATLGEFLAIYFQQPALKESTFELRSEARAGGVDSSVQYDARLVLQGLEGTCSPRAFACLALTDQDLSAPGLHYLFGLGQQRERVGVMSTHRLRKDVRDTTTRTSRPVRDVEFLRRSLKVAVHEVGHQLGLAHCRHFGDCVMAGTASLRANDRSHLMLCPLEHAKLEWQLGFSPRRRFSELADFAGAQRLHKEAAYWSRMAAASPRYSEASGAASE